LLILTTIRRLAVLLFVFLAWAPAAFAWSWPVQGPVLQPFAYDEAHPYAAGQHRGIVIGADSAGETVVAPAAGTVSFAGTVPTNGKTVTIETADGYSVTLTHLGSIAVGKGASVDEQDTVGTVGPSGTPEVDAPYVHLGIRVTTDPNGYVDPLGLLPAPSEGGADESGSTASQPASPGAAAAPPANTPASSTTKRPRPATTRASRAESGRSRVRAHEQQRAQEPRSGARTTRSLLRPVVHPKDEARRRGQRDRASERTRSSRRPVLEAAAPAESARLDAGHEPRPSADFATLRREPSSPLPGLLCNWAAALFALGAVLAARRRRSSAHPSVGAQVLRLPRPEDELRRVSRAA
jgi:MYXO-CTERM domain-containing protein